jgi:hypothetical protein
MNRVRIISPVMPADSRERRNEVVEPEYDSGRLTHGELESALPRWQRNERELERFRSPEELLRRLLADSLSQGDRPLRPLLALAPEDPLAARLVLGAILPALRRQTGWIACHRAHLSSGREGSAEVWELLGFHAWEVICSGFTSPRRRVYPQLLGEIVCRTLTALAADGPLGRHDLAAPSELPAPTYLPTDPPEAD